MKVIVAPDSYKECLSSREVASAVGGALRHLHPDWDIVEMPLADGGEGTAEVLTAALGGRMERAMVSDPLGRPVQARFGIAGGTAVIETAQACGLGLLKSSERNPLITDTRGVGELLLAACNRGCRHFLVGLGGSATCDGGAGMLSVPGLREALSGASIEILCDVDTPFAGADGAARVFGPQKGASPEDVEILERRMLAQAARLKADTGKDVSSVPGAGAAGGLGGALMACFGAGICSGIDKVLDLMDFDRALQDAQLVITGEGRSDRQTLAGKAAYGVLRRSGRVPVALLSGRIEDREALVSAGFRHVVEVTPRDMPLSMALEPAVARQNLVSAAGSFWGREM